jgi:hypothetical protein
MGEVVALLTIGFPIAAMAVVAIRALLEVSRMERSGELGRNPK